MKALALAGLAASLLAGVGPTAARADGDWYLMGVNGACGFRVVDDNTPNSRLGGTAEWWGVVYLAAVRLNGTDRPEVTVECELRVNGVHQGTVLGPTTASGVVTDVAPLTFYSDPGSIVTLCDHITEAGTTTVTCNEATMTLLVPQSVQDVTDPFVAQAASAAHDLKVQLDPTMCPLYAAMASTVNSLGQPQLIWVDPVSGDVYVAGTGSDSVVWDCPPYA